MIELINIISQLLIFILIFSIGNFSGLKKNYLVENYSNLYENYSYNIIIQLNLILFLSFLNINLETIIYVYLIFIFFLLIYNFHFLLLKENYLNHHIYFLFFICLVIFLDISFNLTLSWDTEKFWYQKTLNFYNGYTIDNLTNTNRSNYPHFGDLVWALFWKFSLIAEEYSGRLFYGFFYVISISLLISNLKTKVLYKFIFVLLIVIATYDYRILFSGNKEILIFSILCLLLHSLNKFNFNKVKDTNKEIIFFILAANLLLWSKQEGFVYLISLLIPLVLLFKINKNKKFIIIIFSILFYLIKLFVYKSYNFDLNLKSCCYNDFTIQGIIGKISFDRFLLILSYLAFYLFQNFIFIIGLIILMLGIKNKKFLLKNLYLYLMIFLNFSFIITIYILTDADLDTMLRTGIERLVFMFMPVFIILIVNYINYFDKRLIKLSK